MSDDGCGDSQNENACGDCLHCLRVGMDAALRARGEALTSLAAAVKAKEEAELKVYEVYVVARKVPGYVETDMVTAAEIFEEVVEDNASLRSQLAQALAEKAEILAERQQFCARSFELEAQLAQAREANETLRRAVVKLGQPRQFAKEPCFCNNADKTYCVGMPICKEVRAALSPPSPGSGVATLLCAHCPHPARCGEARSCLCSTACPHGAPGSGVEREEEKP